MKTMSVIALSALAVVSAMPATAGAIKGKVTNPEGEPLAGVLVRLADPDTGHADDVYTDAKGRFRLKTDFEGALALRLRTPYYRDLVEDVELGAKTKLKKSFTMEAMTSPDEISESLPAAYHFGHIPFETGKDGHFSRYQFQRDCLTCHQLGNELTRRVRTPEDWATTIERMHSFLGNFDAELRDRRSRILAKGFDGKPLEVRPDFPFDPMIAKAKITEYQMDEAVLPHDAEVSPDDGLIYTVDQFAEHMAITDPETRKTEYIPVPPEDVPPGGRFAELGMPMNLGGDIRQGPHSLALGPDGKWYTTNAFAARIGVFNPKTRAWEPSIKVGGNSLYPHTIRFDSEGIGWFTLAFSDEMGRLDPETREVTVIALPPVAPGGIAAVSMPYGIDVDPKTGFVWYGRLFGDKIGKVNPKTLEVTEYDSPVKGPRRMRFDKNGILWVTGFSEGMIARIDPDGFKAKVYKMPEFAKGYRPAPYALGINPETQEIWINEILTDRIFRFLPKEERFVIYPVPLRGTYTREISFTEDGTVCMSNNPSPVEALEGGVAQLICIDPDGA